jgi:hypothetical protein
MQPDFQMVYHPNIPAKLKTLRHVIVIFCCQNFLTVYTALQLMQFVTFAVQNFDYVSRGNSNSHERRAD